MKYMDNILLMYRRCMVLLFLNKRKNLQRHCICIKNKNLIELLTDINFLIFNNLEILVVSESTILLYYKIYERLLIYI